MDEFVEETQQVDSQEAQESAKVNADALGEQELKVEEAPAKPKRAKKEKPAAEKAPAAEEPVKAEEPAPAPAAEEEKAPAKPAKKAKKEKPAEVQEAPAEVPPAVEEETPSDDDKQVSAEELADLEQKRSILNNNAERHRRLRDELNNQTKEWKSKRDALNTRVRELVDEAGKCREDRDSFNQKVRETKVLRDERNQKVTALKDQIALMKPERPPEDKNEVPVKQLKKQLQELEYTQQTKSLGKDKENEIVKQISVIAKQIDEREKTYEQSGEIKELIQQLRDAKVQAEAAHRQVAEFAESAQTSHDKMMKLYEEADALRKEADVAQGKFIECKQAADEEHKMHIEQIKSVHEMDKDVAGMKSKKTAARKKKVDTESKKEAKEIFERFKAGEKLSTDNLMALQKSGYL
jgi:uncharacterized coiled-coil DUF342 family protein